MISVYVEGLSGIFLDLAMELAIAVEDDYLRSWKQ